MQHRPLARSPSGLPLRSRSRTCQQARPQWGLDKADIVFEEPVEGGITRFVAVYQCQTAATDRAGTLGPLRRRAESCSRWARSCSPTPGAIQPVIDAIDSPGSLLEDVGADRASGAYTRRQHPPGTAQPGDFDGSALLGGERLRLPHENRATAVLRLRSGPAGGTPASAVHSGSPTWTRPHGPGESGRGVGSGPTPTRPGHPGRRRA